jgi:hypothetical protein
MILSQFKRWAMASCLASASLLVACGGGGSSSSPPPTVTGSQSGILTDAAVQGVSYRTSSGVTGVTGPNGEYNFNPGDTVQFTLGGLTLGNVTATGIISPIQLAGSDANKLNNLLVLFQSLDTDGNPSNGITIPSGSAGAVPSSLNLSQSTSTFASGSNTALVTAMNAGGITRSVTTQASATAHFKEQGLVLLSANVLVMYNTQTAVLLRIMPNGSYMQGQASPDDNCGANGGCLTLPDLVETAGIERGTMSVTGFSTAGYQVTVTVAQDTNIQAGLSHPIPCDSGFLPDGEGFIANGTCEDSGGRINKAPNDNASLVGVWALGTSTSVLTQHFVFLPNGKFLMVDPLGDTQLGVGHPCGGPGVEFGSYSWNATTGVLTISNVTYDTNSCAGLQDRSGTIRINTEGQSVSTGVVNGVFTGTVVLSSNGQVATVTPTNEPGNNIYRVSK